MTDAAFEKLVAAMAGGETPRVWSLLITVFGELTQAEGARIGGAVLSRLTELIGIRPEAVRVALHRLRKDGWIESHRSGRSSDHVLTDWGRRQSVEATPRIYADGPAAGEAWLVLADPGHPTGRPAGGVALAAHMTIVAAPPKDTDAFCILLDRGNNLPGWMTARICGPETVEQTRGLAGRLDDLQRLLPATERLSPLQIAVLRVLLVHSWRRIVLKLPALPDHVFPGRWQGDLCRARITVLLERLPRQTLASLSREAAAPA